MLIISRYPQEKIVIGNAEIIIKLLKIENDQAWLGITAPNHIDINREEIFFKNLPQQLPCGQVQPQLNDKEENALNHLSIRKKKRVITNVVRRRSSQWIKKNKGVNDDE